MMAVKCVKWFYKPSASTKKTWGYRLWNFFATVQPLIAIIIAGRIAYSLKLSDNRHDYYIKKLAVVGQVPPGLDILRIPKFRHPMGQFFADVLPLTLIAFMEAYSIARNIGAQTNTLNSLSASQEMFANGAANLLGCVSSCYPVSGSFSRSALVRYICLFVLIYFFKHNYCICKYFPLFRTQLVGLDRSYLHSFLWWG